MRRGPQRVSLSPEGGINVFEPIFQELPSIRQGHNEKEGLRPEIPFPKVQERATALAQAVADLLQSKREAA